MNFLRALFGLGFKTISIRDYRETFQNVNHTLVDVRTREEFRSGHVAHAVSIPLDQLERRHDEIAMDLAVVVICASGSRSRLGAAMLAGAGHTPVINISGGTGLWASMGLPLKR
jgi:rhodanese-related sulfurtransferase